MSAVTQVLKDTYDDVHDQLRLNRQDECNLFQPAVDTIQEIDSNDEGVNIEEYKRIITSRFEEQKNRIIEGRKRHKMGVKLVLKKIKQPKPILESVYATSKFGDA